MFVGTFKLNDVITIPCVTASPSTGAAKVADSSPTYRIYKANSTIPVQTGSMAALDNINTTGLYGANVQLSLVKGFIKGKSYVVYVEAVVETIKGTTVYTFQINS